MSNNIDFRFSKKTRIFIFGILGVAVFGALLIIIYPASIEQREAFTNFLLGIVALETGLMLYGLRKKFPAWEKFLDSMTILVLFMASVGLSIPLFLAYRVDMYYLLPTYLICLNGWLFFAQHIIYCKNNWQKDPTKKWALLPWFILMGSFFPGAIALVVLAPEIPNWVSP